MEQSTDFSLWPNCFQAISAEIAALERSLRSAPLRMRSQQKACNLPQQNENIQTELHQLMDRLQGLQTLAAEPADSVALVATQAPPQMTTRTHRPSTPSSSASRPQSAPYHAIIDAPDDASVVSWSADAFGRSRNPGWCVRAQAFHRVFMYCPLPPRRALSIAVHLSHIRYHLNRKELYAQRARLKRAVPKGCFDSYGKYADEASRIQNTGRLAF
eukprot:scaffold304118_cov32-Tisochrysis_lutea.AAC.1